MKVTPIRFTSDVAAMARFCQALGLRPDVESAGGGWATLSAAGGGVVGLHDSVHTDEPRASGQTVLSFEAEHLEPLAEQLSAAGFDPVIVDESYGRSLRVVDPDGVTVQVNEAMTDFYGYRVHETSGGTSGGQSA